MSELIRGLSSQIMPKDLSLEKGLPCITTWLHDQVTVKSLWIIHHLISIELSYSGLQSLSFLLIKTLHGEVSEG